MSTPTHESAAGRLAAAVKAELAASAAGPVVRVAVDAAGADAIDWLRGSPAGARFYWRSREGDVVAAGTGEALEAHGSSPADLASALDDVPPDGAVFLTGRFDGSVAPADEWAPFGHVRAVLPRIELRTDAGVARLACYITEADRDDPARVDAWLDRMALSGSGDGLPAPAALTSRAGSGPRRDLPGESAWMRAMVPTLEALHAGTIHKVVLARRSTWELASPIDPIEALGRVATHAPSCFHALVERGESSFLSATPERLFRFDHGRVSTEAVAGTLAADAPIMAFREKDMREHAFVVDDVRSRLADLADDVKWDDAPGVLRLARRRHLRTRIAAAARAGAGPLDVLAALHPTPAVGGAPRDAALDFIRRREGFDRGLYAGYVGRITRDRDGQLGADVAVGIRSALLEPRRVSLYAGAGIVPGSDPKGEWDEVEGKMSDLAQALGLA